MKLKGKGRTDAAFFINVVSLVLGLALSWFFYGAYVPLESVFFKKARGHETDVDRRSRELGLPFKKKWQRTA